MKDLICRRNHHGIHIVTIIVAEKNDFPLCACDYLPNKNRHWNHIIEMQPFLLQRPLVLVINYPSSTSSQSQTNMTFLCSLFFIFIFLPLRYADLECIYSQLTSHKGNKMEMLLDAVESSYSPAFQNIRREVRAGNHRLQCEK